MSATIANTTLAFGLSEFPVSLRKAGEKKDVTFDRAIVATDEDGKRTYEHIERVERAASAAAAVGLGGSVKVSRNKIVASEEEVAPEIVHGVWVSEDEFNEVPADALSAVKLDTQIQGISIEEFMPLKDVNWERVEAAYYLVPLKGQIGAKPLKMLRDAMKAEKVAGVCKLMLRSNGRQKLAIIHEANGGVMVNLLAFAHDFEEAQEAADALKGVAVDRRLVMSARSLISAMKADGSQPYFIDTAVDDAISMREKLYLDAVEGKTVKKAKAKKAKAEPVGDLMAALEASIEQARRDKVTA